MNNKYTKRIVILILLVIVLFAITLIAPNFHVGSNYVEPIKAVITNDNPVTEANYESEKTWATSGGQFPSGWEQSSVKVGDKEYQIIGPVGNKESFIIPIDAKSLPLLGENKKCVGDSESAICAVGINPDVVRYFNVITFRD